MDIVGVYTHSV